MPGKSAFPVALYLFSVPLAYVSIYTSFPIFAPIPRCTSCLRENWQLLFTNRIRAKNRCVDSPESTHQSLLSIQGRLILWWASIAPCGRRTRSGGSHCRWSAAGALWRRSLSWSGRSRCCWIAGIRSGRGRRRSIWRHSAGRLNTRSAALGNRGRLIRRHAARRSRSWRRRRCLGCCVSSLTRRLSRDRRWRSDRVGWRRHHGIRSSRCGGRSRSRRCGQGSARCRCLRRSCRCSWRWRGCRRRCSPGALRGSPARRANKSDKRNKTFCHGITFLKTKSQAVHTSRDAFSLKSQTLREGHAIRGIQ